MDHSRPFNVAHLRPRGILLTVLAVLSGYVLGHYVSAGKSNSDAVFCDTEYSLLNPYLRCEPAETLKKAEYTVFKKRLESYIDDKKSSGDVDTIAVYFRDLENGPWFGIEEDALFSPASLLKLPILVAYYKKAETAPQILEFEIETTGTGSNEQGLSPEESLQSGKQYTIDELLRRMIVYSDNAALNILIAFLAQSSPDDDIYSETLASMGLANSEASLDDFLTVKRYSSFYRALYNASFLSKEMSQKALQLLTQTTFHQGIESGVPDNIRVAHKYGRRLDESLQLHDCGIVYYPETPYLLCIMTRGSNEKTNTGIIQDISRMVFDEVVSRATKGM